MQKKINNSHILWFEQSNQWIQLEEPAWFVNQLNQKGIDSCTIASKCVEKYHLSHNESLRLVNEICNGVAELSKSVAVPLSDSDFLEFPYSFEPYSTRHYKVRNKHFSFFFETHYAEYCIHPSLAHLETERSKISVQFEIYHRTNFLGLMEKGHPETATTFHDFNRLKKRLYINMANTIYDKTIQDWMTFVHASALTDGKHTLLLCSSSGSGKSSMAALLQVKGLQLVSDDFVPIDAKQKRAFPFPAAISIREGAFTLLSPYYTGLTGISNCEHLQRSVRYLPPKSTGISYFKSRPVNGIVFIHYNPDVPCDFKYIPTNEALKLFHEQAWVSGNREHAKTFLNWFVKLPCYRLEYGNTNEGIDKVLGIFAKGK